MSRQKNHNFWFAVTNAPKHKSDVVSISLNYKYNSVKRTPTPIRIPFEMWDNKAKKIKPIVKHDSSQVDTYNSLLLLYRSRIHTLRPK